MLSKSIRTIALMWGIVIISLPGAASAEDGGGSAIAGFDVFGRIILDYGVADGDNTAFDASDGELRAARIGATASVLGRATVKAEIVIDEDGDLSLVQAYVDYAPGAPGLKLRAGQFKTPNSLDEQTSGRFTSFHERAAFTDAFAFNRRIGVAAIAKAGPANVTLGIFGQNLEGEPTFGGYAIAGRVTVNPALGAADTKAHLGASFRYRDVDNDQSLLRYRQRPVIHTANRIIGTGNFAGSDLFLGGEAAVVQNRFWAAAEYAVTFANCNTCIDDPNLSGGYVEVGYVVNGRRVLGTGRFDRFSIDEDSTIGAIALALRFDTIDLASNAIDGGGYNSLVAGADWWPRRDLKIGVNGFWVDADLGSTVSGLDPAIAVAITNGVRNENVVGLNLRAQFDF